MRKQILLSFLAAHDSEKIRWLESISPPGSVGLPAHEAIWDYTTKIFPRSTINQVCYDDVMIYDRGTVVAFKLKFPNDAN